MEKSQKRQIAYKLRINDILAGEYVKEEGEWVPNYIRVGNKKASRVNLVAVVVADNRENQSLIIDDGSGKISIRSFDQNGFDEIKVGDIVMVIGRPREYFDEKYIVTEAVKRIENPLWVEVRKLELGSEKIEAPEPVAEEELQPVEDTYKKVFELIKEMDVGEGAETQEVIAKSKIGETEEIITRLLEQGEVFEIKPGRLKILE